MDPEHATCFAQAQLELRELFHELECNGRVSAAELRRSLVPFTAGDVKRDLLELLAELKIKRQSLDEAEFLRVMWRKMYLTSAIDATKGGSAGQHKPINVSLAHVIVSVKRRQQLRQFANYYASRGISGADQLATSPKGASALNNDLTSAKGSPLQPKELPSPQQQLRQPSDKAGGAAATDSIVALRRRHSPCYDVVACVFDADALQMQARTLLARARGAEVRNCSQLYCLLFTKEAGNFVLGCTYFGETAHRSHQDEKDEFGIVTESESDLLGGVSLYRTLSWADRDDRGLLMLRMEELGLRNIVAAASNRASFAASTGRKLHQWRALEPYRVLQGPNEEEVQSSQPQQTRCSTEAVKGNNELRGVEASAEVRMLDADPPGDCFGLLGGKPLLSRTKTIADVGDLRQVAAGDTFFMSISSSGGLYSWESSPSAASSSSSTAPPLGRACAIPERVPWFASPEKVNRVACGAQHAIVLASSGLYAWGANIYGQLGLGAHCSPADPHTLEPAPVKLPTDCSPALDVACGDTHSVVLTVAGQVLTFGCNWEGQLGIGESRYDGTLAATGCAHEPLLVHLPQGPEVSGDTRSYLITAGPQTTVAVSTNGQVFQWGKCVPDGIDGVCGRVSRWLPEELKAINHDATGSAPGPVWQSVTSADGLVVLARHAGLSGAAIGQQQHSSG